MLNPVLAFDATHVTVLRADATNTSLPTQCAKTLAELFFLEQTASGSRNRQHGLTTKIARFDSVAIRRLARDSQDRAT